MRVIIFILFIFIVSCNPRNTGIHLSVDNWNNSNLQKLENCCPNFDNSMNKILLIKYFEKNIRHEVLKSLPINNINSFEISELLFYNEYYISMNYNDTKVNMVYDTISGKLKRDNSNLGLFEEINLDILNIDKSSCCDTISKPNSLFFHSKFKIIDNDVHLINSFSK